METNLLICINSILKPLNEYSEKFKEALFEARFNLINERNRLLTYQSEIKYNEKKYIATTISNGEQRFTCDLSIIGIYMQNEAPELFLEINEID